VGRQALTAVIDDLRQRGVQQLYTSCGQGESSPEGFYRSLGFMRTGEMAGDEIELVLQLNPGP
jgi:diamine N-acetyltransferase